MQESLTRSLAVIAGCAFSLWSSLAMAQQKPVTLEYFSWSIFRLTAPSGEVILTNPFVTNPDSPVKVADFPKVDGIVVADGHADEVGSTDQIALATGAKVITSFEMYNVLVRAAQSAAASSVALWAGRHQHDRQRKGPQRDISPWFWNLRQD
jgi:L-ascorbate metabolism protein UlaG (beta-lactamase superfamily)